MKSYKSIIVSALLAGVTLSTTSCIGDLDLEPNDPNTTTALAEKNYYGTSAYYNFNQNASEYYKGDENKLAIFATHDWDITPKFNLYYGVRLEWQRSKGENAAVRNAEGKYVGRFANYHLGATAADGTVIAPVDYAYNWLNTVYTAALTYKVTKQFGFTGDFTYNTQRPAMNSFAPAEMPLSVQEKYNAIEEALLSGKSVDELI